MSLVATRLLDEPIIRPHMDARMGEILAELEEAGLAENTIVFYYSDHGGVLGRSKRFLYETGTHVPMIIRIPENFKHLVDLKRGSRTKGFVEFVDFGPTVLHLAGVKPHRLMDGSAFMGAGITGAQLAARNESFGYADRMDEKYDHVRSLRVG